MNDQEYPLPPTAPLESRTGREPVPQYSPTFGRAALLLFDLPALPAAPANPAGLAAAVLTGPRRRGRRRGRRLPAPQRPTRPARGGSCAAPGQEPAMSMDGMALPAWKHSGPGGTGYPSTAEAWNRWYTGNDRGWAPASSPATTRLTLGKACPERVRPRCCTTAPRSPRGHGRPACRSNQQTPGHGPSPAPAAPRWTAWSWPAARLAPAPSSPGSHLPHPHRHRSKQRGSRNPRE